MEEKFRSTVTLYPGKSSSVTFSEVTSEAQSVTTFGDEEEAEQMLQILESANIRNRIVEKYDLFEHYDIDTSGPYKRTELIETYYDLITFERNNKGAVLINVLDKSPDTAAYIANDIAALYDSAKNKIIHERAELEFRIKAAELRKLEAEMGRLRDTLLTLSAMGVVNYDAYEGLTQAVITAKDGELRDAYMHKIRMTDKYGAAFKSFEMEIEQLSERISSMKTVYQKAETDAKANISHKFEVEMAMISEKKAYPIRWIIVAVSTLSTVFFSIILLMFMEKFKELKTKL